MPTGVFVLQQGKKKIVCDKLFHKKRVHTWNGVNVKAEHSHINCEEDCQMRGE